MTKDSSIIITIFLISIFTFITLLSLPQSVESSEITLIAGGDVAWCLVVKAPEIYYDGKKRNKWERIYYRVARKMGIGKRDWIRMPYLATPQSKKTPILMSSKMFSTLERWFTGVRLLGSYLTRSSRLFPRCSRQRLLTDAAEGGLRPAPAGRPRRVDSSISYAASHAELGATALCVAATHFYQSSRS